MFAASLVDARLDDQIAPPHGQGVPGRTGETRTRKLMPCDSGLSSQSSHILDLADREDWCRPTSRRSTPGAPWGSEPGDRARQRLPRSPGSRRGRARAPSGTLWIVLDQGDAAELNDHERGDQQVRPNGRTHEGPGRQFGPRPVPGIELVVRLRLDDHREPGSLNPSSRTS